MSKSLVMADCNEGELKAFIGAIKDAGIDAECYSLISNGGRQGRFSNLRRYLKYFIAPYEIYKKRNNYEWLIGWQQFYALNFGFWSRLFHAKKVNKVIAVNFTYKKKNGLIGALYRFYMKKCICNDYIDYFHVPSPQYAKMAAEDFNIPISKFIVAPFGIDDVMEKYGNMEKPNRAPEEGYVLSIGRSNRDYDFLVNVWRNLDAKLVIISDEYKNDDLPQNVMLINDVNGDDQYPWISNCRALIIPIDDTRICSGDTVLLTAMSLGKCIFVTNPSTLSEMYVDNDVNAIYINKNVEETRNIISENLNTNDRIGENARNTFLEKFSRYSMGSTIAKYIINEF